jgi:ligand-binding sensor domain-containing protein/signal transduction histidine kinase
VAFGQIEFVILLLVALACSGIARAERLPLRHFTTQEGLAGNTVHSIVRDSRGLLWFCTNDGLSRFDGHSFITFGAEHGLGDQEVYHLLETADGGYWVGTARGFSRINPLTTASGAVSFTNLLPGVDRRSQWIQKAMQDHAGRIWIATNGGLYRMSARAGQNPIFQHVPLALPAEPESSPRILALVEDRFGEIWAGGDGGLYRVHDDGRIERYSTADGLPANTVVALSLDSEGSLWVGLDGGLCRLKPQRAERAAVDRLYTTKNGLPNDYVFSLLPSGSWVWAGTMNGLVRFQIAGRDTVKVFGPASGLRHPNVEALEKDGQNNIWIGTMGGGASRLSSSGFTTYGSSDGLASVEIAGMVESRAGELYAISNKGSYDLALNRFEGERFVAIRPRVPRGLTQFGWGWAQVVLQDKFGEWWIASSGGVLRYPSVRGDELAITESRRVLRTSRELPAGTVFRIFEDSRGDVWISTSGYGAHGLTRWERATQRIERVGHEDGLPGPATDDRSLASAFAEDAGGTVWIGFHRGGLFRFRAGQLLPVRSISEGAALEGVRWIHRDSKGRLWIAGRKGLLRVDEPRAEQPVFRHYGVAEGLASSFVLSITEDHLGRIYVGSGRGVNRLDPDTGQIRHYGQDDGLVGGDIRVAHCDRQGHLWFASTEGLSRYDPRQEQSLPAPGVYISYVRLGSHVQQLAQTGQGKVSVHPLSWRYNAFYVEFTGVGNALQYEYRLEGVDTNWSEASELRSVTYPGLGAGSYHFLVRAINPEGIRSRQPAVVQFRIKPPFWATWWLRSTVAALILTALFLFHRMRIARALAIERIRRRIAQDLHDDLGASLSQTALLSDLLQREKAVQNITACERLDQISSICRGALESMSDIVWAINPEKDKTSNLVQRMRRFGEEVLVTREVQFNLHDDSALDIVLDPRIRHEMFLVFKEAIHNVVRHSGANSVHVQLSANAPSLVLQIEDDGCGLSSDSNVHGHGLGSMRERVLALGGTMRVETGAKGGTSLEFTIPITRVRR